MRVLLLALLVLIGAAVLAAPTSTASHDCGPWYPGWQACDDPCSHESWNGHVRVWFLLSACWRLT